MTKEQIEMLRTLIQGEIEAALQNQNGYKFAFEQEVANEQGWQTFIDSFTEWAHPESSLAKKFDLGEK